MKKKLFYLKLMFLTLMSVQMNAQEVLDQSNPIFNASTDFTTVISYQTFQAGLTGFLSQVKLKMSGTGQATISITATNASGVPVGSNLTSQVVNVAIGNGITDVIFANPILITAGTKYAIKIEKNGSYFMYHHNFSDTYANGSAFSLSLIHI